MHIAGIMVTFCNLSLKPPRCFFVFVYFCPSSGEKIPDVDNKIKCMYLPVNNLFTNKVYPPGNKHITPWEKESNLQKCLGRGYVKSQEGNLCTDFVIAMFVSVQLAYLLHKGCFTSQIPPAKLNPRKQLILGKESCDFRLNKEGA